MPQTTTVPQFSRPQPFVDSFEQEARAYVASKGHEWLSMEGTYSILEPGSMSRLTIVNLFLGLYNLQMLQMRQIVKMSAKPAAVTSEVLVENLPIPLQKLENYENLKKQLEDKDISNKVVRAKSNVKYLLKYILNIIGLFLMQ